jgi:hypothetical protein
MELRNMDNSNKIEPQSFKEMAEHFHNQIRKTDSKEKNSEEKRYNNVIKTYIEREYHHNRWNQEIHRTYRFNVAEIKRILGNEHKLTNVKVDNSSTNIKFTFKTINSCETFHIYYSDLGTKFCLLGNAKYVRFTKFPMLFLFGIFRPTFRKKLYIKTVVTKEKKLDKVDGEK